MSPSHDVRLRKIQARLEEAGRGDREAFEAALAEESCERALRFIRGVRAYQAHPARRDLPEKPILRRIGATALRDYGVEGATVPAVLVVPSLINRYDILDLDSEMSFLRSLAARGYRPFVVDWGCPGDDEKNFTVEDYLTRLLALMPDRCHVLGYCMGGLLTLALSAVSPERVKSLSLIAVPWDFHAPDAMLAASFAAMVEQAEPILSASDKMPVDAIQALFASLQPLAVMTKFMDFAHMDPDGDDARRFVLVEDWLNDGVPLTANVARTCLRNWYGQNATARLEWSVRGKTVDPRAIDVPAYVIAAGRDRIVPPASALPLAKLLPNVTLHEPITGHVGLLASRNASRQVWAPLFQWLQEHS